ncbi:hypothetical protein [Streptomyces yangpuensis]|nr:hypothetical protein [Streptomyces yangpuensis]
MARGPGSAFAFASDTRMFAVTSRWTSATVLTCAPKPIGVSSTMWYA